MLSSTRPISKLSDWILKETAAQFEIHGWLENASSGGTGVSPGHSLGPISLIFSSLLRNDAVVSLDREPVLFPMHSATTRYRLTSRPHCLGHDAWSRIWHRGTPSHTICSAGDVSADQERWQHFLLYRYDILGNIRHHWAYELFVLVSILQGRCRKNSGLWLLLTSIPESHRDVNDEDIGVMFRNIQGENQLIY